MLVKKDLDRRRGEELDRHRDNCRQFETSRACHYFPLEGIWWSAELHDVDIPFPGVQTLGLFAGLFLNEVAWRRHNR